MTPYPLLFEQNLKERVWGGQRLAGLGKVLPRGAPIGESWEIADLPPEIPAGQSIVSNGLMRGHTLHELIQMHPRVILGNTKLTAEGLFPLLVKYLDARENLSVQVHPDSRYVRKHPDARMKNEAWVVLEAEPGSVIYKGLQPHVTAEQFRNDIQQGTAAEDLIAVPVEPGQCHHLPSGTCHALGAGVLVAEVQTPSDTTFRVFDWGRTGRDLHIEQAMECIRFGSANASSESRIGSSVIAGSFQSEMLVRTADFSIERIESRETDELDVVTSGEPIIWMVLAGGITLTWPDLSSRNPMAVGECVDLQKGATVLMPASLRGATASVGRGSQFLRITGPSSTGGMIA